MTLEQRTALLSQLIAAKTPAQQHAVCLAINDLTDDQRISMRNAAMEAGVQSLPRNLYYNYQTQRWIED